MYFPLTFLNAFEYALLEEDALRFGFTTATVFEVTSPEQPMQELSCAMDLRASYSSNDNSTLAMFNISW